MFSADRERATTLHLSLGVNAQVVANLEAFLPSRDNAAWL
jgi:hypothetical protein